MIRIIAMVLCFAASVALYQPSYAQSSLSPSITSSLQQRFGGRVVGVSQGRDDLRRVKLLRPNGRVVIVTVDPRNGRVVHVKK